MESVPRDPKRTSRSVSRNPISSSTSWRERQHSQAIRRVLHLDTHMLLRTASSLASPCTGWEARLPLGNSRVRLLRSILCCTRALCAFEGREPCLQLMAWRGRGSRPRERLAFRPLAGARRRSRVLVLFVCARFDTVNEHSAPHTPCPMLQSLSSSLHRDNRPRTRVGQRAPRVYRQ